MTKPEASFSPGARSLAALAAVGIVAALWSLFQWSELLLVRAGGSAFCGLGGAVDCATVWETGFASGVHRLTGLPVAGWGLVWSLTALALPLWALMRKGEERSPGGLVSAIRVVAGAGVASVVVLASVSFSAGAICLACVGTYILVGAYAAIALYGWRRAGFPTLKRGVIHAGGATLAAFLLLLYPGLRTPTPADVSGQSALARASSPGAHDHAHAHGEASPGHGEGTGHAERDATLADFVGQLDRATRQGLADSLLIFERGPEVPMREPRAVMGQAAPVHITEFSDIQCGHCAQLHITMSQLKEHFPEGWFSVDARNFPLDGACNPHVQRSSEDAISCHAARARICFEGSEHAFSYSGRLFSMGRNLSFDRIVALAEPYMSASELRTCMQSEETEAKLQADIEYAMAHDAHGTPIVLVNGRKGTSFGPFLYAMILTGGEGTHPAFAELPAPNPNAHMH
jgi:hypothetical protein